MFHLILIKLFLSYLPRQTKDEEINGGFLLIYYVPTHVHVQLAIFYIQLKGFSMLYLH